MHIKLLGLDYDTLSSARGLRDHSCFIKIHRHDNLIHWSFLVHKYYICNDLGHIAPPNNG